MKTGLISFMISFFALCIMSCDGSSKTSNCSAKSEPLPEIVEDTTSVTKKESTHWEYFDSVDEMTDKKTYMAEIVSENDVNFDFPYQGGSKLSFTIRESPQYGKDMLIRISKGQFNIGIYGETIKVRFDDEPAFDVKCTESSDYSTDVLFLNTKFYKKMLEKLKTSKTMKINAEFFNEGNHTFTFIVSGLEWNH